MKKSACLLISPFLIAILLLISGPFNILKLSAHSPRAVAGHVPVRGFIPEKGEGARIVLIRGEDKEEKGGGTDPHFLQILKKLQEKLNEWLKSLNERIENQDVTRLEVRFLEILRNILEWVKEKIDAKIESGEKERPKKQERGLFRETRQKIPQFVLG